MVIKQYWSAAPGRFLNKLTGEDAFLASEGTRILSLSPGPSFRGKTSEWYETLVETIYDVAIQLEKETKCRATQIVTNPSIIKLLKQTVVFEPVRKMNAEDKFIPKKIEDILPEEVGILGEHFKVIESRNHQLCDEVHVQVFDPMSPETLLKQGTVKVLDL
jgi:hypothetical protein